MIKGKPRISKEVEEDLVQDSVLCLLPGQQLHTRGFMSGPAILAVLKGGLEVSSGTV